MTPGLSRLVPLPGLPARSWLAASWSSGSRPSVPLPPSPSRRESCAAPAALPTSGSCSESRARWRSSLRPAAPRGAPAPSPDPVRHSVPTAGCLYAPPPRSLASSLGSPLPRPLGPLLFKFESESSEAQLRRTRLLGRDGPTRFPARVLRDPALITGIVRPCEDLVPFVVPKTMHTNRRLRLCLVLSICLLIIVLYVLYHNFASI